MKKKIVSFTVIGFFLIMFPLLARANIVDNGVCGNGVMWTLDENGLLTISGTGEMTSHPWLNSLLPIKKIIVEYGVTNIIPDAFVLCNKLTDIEIANSVTSIGTQAFSRCTSLSSIIIPESVISIEPCAFEECTSLENITISNGVTTIDGCAFKNCISLKSIIIPESITTIGDGPFFGCTGLKSATVKARSNNIWFPGIFSSCSNLECVNIPADHRAYCSIDGVVFNKSKNTLVYYPRGKKGPYTIPDPVSSIEIGAFQSCNGLTSITIPETVQEIPDWSFLDCYNLQTINLYAQIESYYIESMFRGCSSLININIPPEHKLYSSKDGIVYNKSGTELVCFPHGRRGSYSIPEAVNSINPQAFSNCPNLTSITIPNSVLRIGAGAFSGCSGLSTIVIPDSVTDIGYGAFVSCSSLSTIVLPKHLDTINDGLFSNCTTLTSITIPSTVTQIGEAAFQGSGLTSISLPSSVTHIGRQAFKDTHIQIVHLSEEITSIGYQAFDQSVLIFAEKNCYAAEWAYDNYYTCIFSILYLPYSLKAIEKEAFVNLKCQAVIIPEGCTAIGEYAFSGCQNLLYIKIPASIDSYPTNAFYGCNENLIIDWNK